MDWKLPVGHHCQFFLTLTLFWLIFDSSELLFFCLTDFTIALFPTRYVGITPEKELEICKFMWCQISHPKVSTIWVPGFDVWLWPCSTDVTQLVLVVVVKIFQADIFFRDYCCLWPSDDFTRWKLQIALWSVDTRQAHIRLSTFLVPHVCHVVLEVLHLTNL